MPVKANAVLHVFLQHCDEVVECAFRSRCKKGSVIVELHSFHLDVVPAFYALKLNLNNGLIRARYLFVVYRLLIWLVTRNVTVYQPGFCFVRGRRNINRFICRITLELIGPLVFEETHEAANGVPRLPVHHSESKWLSD